MCFFLLVLQGANRSPSPHGGRPGNFNMATATSSGKLAQEIHEEFLTCKICLESYKSPKSLQCLHTFCEQCIEQHVMSESTYKKYSDYREFTCPLCRKRTQLPIGGVKKLPDNFMVSAMSEIVQRQKPSKYPFCDICKMTTRKHRDANSKCLDCAKLLCSQCVKMHRDTKVTANHSIFDVEIEKDIECKEHEDEVVRFYCEPCETCICVLCTFNEHKDHEISQFGDAVTKYKENIEVLLGSCKEKITKFDTQLESLNSCSDIIKTVEQKVHDHAIKLIQDIRTREKSLIEELQNIYGKDCMDIIENKKDLSSQVDSLRSTCNLTEVILKGKDIELLLLKKDVQQKLATLNTVNIKDLPKTINKVVNFMPGMVNLGHIQDQDRPLATSHIRARGDGSEMEFESVQIPVENKQTQTDSTITKLGKKTRKDKDDESDSSESEDEEDSDSESDSDESDEEETKKELKDTAVQTEKQMDSDSSSSSSSDSDSDSESDSEGPEMTDTGTMTDEIQTAEVGVNTRSRSLQQPASARRSTDNAPAEEDTLAARRRRRRERAQQQMGGQSLDVADEDLDKNRYRRSGHFGYDGDNDVFYDADNARHTGNHL